MDNRKTSREIGLIQTAINLASVYDSDEVIEEVGITMPMPARDISDQVPEIVNWLRGFEKKKYLFLTPEIALIEEIGNHLDSREEAIIALPGDLDPEAQERIRNNIPRNIKITVQSEYEIPRSFYPSNGMIVICGYVAGGRLMVLPETYRLIGRYSNFLGKKVFIPYQELDIAARYDTWMEISPDCLSVRWRAES